MTRDRAMTDVALARVVSLLPDAVLVVDELARLVWANPAAAELFGLGLDEWFGRSGLELVHPADVELAASAIETVQGKPVGTPIEVRVRTAHGWRLVEVVGRNALDDPQVGGIVLSLRDLTQRRRWEIARDDGARMRTVIHNSPTMTFLVSASGTIEALSGAVTRLLGHDPEVLEGTALAELVEPSDRDLVAGAFEAAEREGAGSVARPVTTRVRILRRGTGSSMPVELAVVSLLDDPTLGGFIVAAQDVTALSEASDALSALAHRDSVTGLANRIAATDALERGLTAMVAAGQPLAVIFLDLDGFKAVNDTLGHDAGDALLAAVAARFSSVVRSEDLVARYAGDEFLVAAALDEAGAEQLRQRLVSCLDEPLDLGTPRPRVSVSSGLAMARPGDTVADVIRRADERMYAEKRQRSDT